MNPKLIKALVVDDDRPTLLIIGKALESMGIIPILCSSPVHAVQIVADNPIEILITDFQMPEMNGAELIDTLDKSNPDKKRATIMTSGVVSLPQINKFLESGVDYFLPKPVNLRELCLYLKRILEAKKSGNGESNDQRLC
jgi:two-component system sensor histidine kinase EvgS